MPFEKRIKTRNLKSRYVDDQPGWKILFFSLIIGAIFGLSFRLYFSPGRIKSTLNELIRKNDVKGLSFEEAELKLSRGSIPQLGLVLRGVKFAPAPECKPEPSVSIAELTLPFRLTSFFAGKVALSVVSAEDLIVDIDAAKTRCNEKTSVVPTSEKSVADTSENLEPNSVPNEAPEALVWWREEDLSKVRGLIRGFDFTRVDLIYENKTKHIYLDEFSARLPRFNGPIELSTLVVVPPDVSYGEKLPAFSLEAEAWADHADVEVNAHMSEGRLAAQFEFKPGPEKSLATEARFEVSDVPLSEMVPLLVKSGIVPDEFKPRSLWFDCSANISGPFQQIFDHSPLHLTKCAVKGDGALIEVPQATRQPTGVWDPFAVKLTRVSIAKVLETVGAKGPEGIASDLGRLNGSIDLTSKEDAHFSGSLEGLKLAFRRHNVRAEQKLPTMEAYFNLANGRFKGAMDKIVVENGEFAGRVEFDFDRQFKNGYAKGELSSLIFDPKIQKLLVNGLLGPMSGKGEVVIANAKMTSLDAELKIGKTDGDEIRFEKASFDARLVDSGSIGVVVEAPVLEFNKASTTAVAMTPLFFEHRFEGDWITLSEARFNARIPEGGGVRWSEAQAKLENGQITLKSEGVMSLERRLLGWVEVDYPLAKRLRFALGGTATAPVLTDNSPSLTSLRSKAPVDDSVLGLKIQTDQ